MQAVLSNLAVDGQIYARNPVGLVEGDLLCQALDKHAIMGFLFDTFIKDVWVVSGVGLEDV